MDKKSQGGQPPHLLGFGSLKANVVLIKPNRCGGQSLIELIIALGVGVAMISAASAALFLLLRSDQLSAQNSSAANLTQSLSNNVSALAESNWRAIYDLAHGSGNHYWVATSTGQLLIQSGDEQTTVDGTTFTRYFYVEPVSRDSNGVIEAAYNSANDDPSTQKLNLVASWQISGSLSSIASATYLTRWQNSAFRETDWSGGAGQTGPITQASNKFDSQTNVDFITTPGSIVPASCDSNCILISSIFDTGISGGAALNTIMWQGNQPAGTAVKFQIASSNSSSGPWNYLGSDGSGSTYYSPAGPDVQVKIRSADHNNKRYFRYKIFFDTAGASVPRVDDVIIGYSR